jgi:hypothetical protein
MQNLKLKEMMVRKSFDLALTNFIIGLSKGSRLLSPYSTQFRALGYSKLYLFPSFTSASHRCVPDSLLSSRTEANTLILEWTNSSTVNKDNADQFGRYSRITSTELVNQAGIPASQCKTSDFLLTVTPDGMNAHAVWLASNKANVHLTVFSTPKGIEKDYYFQKRSTSLLSSTRLEALLSNGIKVSRIPTYIPFPIEHIGAKNTADAALTWLQSELLIGSSKFTTEDLCKKHFKLWGVLSTEKQRSLMNAVRKILKEFIVASSKMGLLEADSKADLWSITKTRTQVAAMKKEIRTAIRKTSQKLRGVPETEALFSEEDEV